MRQPDDRQANIGPEVEHDGEERADMHRDVDHQALVGHTGKLWQQYKVPGRRNRQKFGDSLDDSDDENVKKRHAVILPVCRRSYKALGVKGKPQ